MLVIIYIVGCDHFFSFPSVMSFSTKKTLSVEEVAATLVANFFSWPSYCTTKR